MREILNTVFFTINTPHLTEVSVLFLTAVALLAWAYYKKRKHKANAVSYLQNKIDDQAFCLEAVTEERDWLLKEIHHRVKNSLQIVMSLLNTQLAYLKNEEAVKAIRNSQHRMYSISLVHQMLYQAESISRIDIVKYMRELLEYLKDAYQTEGKIDFMLELEPLSLDVFMALPFGLIVNEAVSNALKYAFPGSLAGALRISLISSDGAVYTLQIVDNGVGFQENDSSCTTNSLGKNLMAGLANQLGGTYEIKNMNGVEITVSFNSSGEKIFKNHYQQS